MNIKIYRDTNTAIFKMENKLDDIKLAAKHAPKSLQVVDDAGDIVFSVACVSRGYGSLNAVGAEFGPEVGADGKAKISVPVPANCEDVKLYIADEYGSAINYLAEVDRNISTALENIAQQRTHIRNIVQIVE